MNGFEEKEEKLKLHFNKLRPLAMQAGIQLSLEMQ